jgi:undecaprenyl-diphosphatase
MSEHTPRLFSSTQARLIAGKLLLFVVLAIAVAELSVVARADIALANSIHSLATGWLTTAAMVVTELASTEVILIATAAAVVVLAARRHWRGAIALAISVLATQAVVSLAKVVAERPRPDEHGAIVHPSGFSFPSAHSASAVALYIMLALIAGTALRGRIRDSAWALAIALALAIGVSRVYLGAHYPTDVLAGWLTGGILVVGAWALCARLPGRGTAPAAA